MVVPVMGAIGAAGETAGKGTGVMPQADRVAEARERIARAALDELPDPGGVVLLEAGPLAESVAALLPPGSGLTVVTNSVPVALLLSHCEGLSVHLLGGCVRKGSGATLVGPQVLEQIHVDVAFVTADGVSPERGLTCADPSEVVSRQAVVRASDKVVLLTEHTRIGRDRLSRFARFAEVDHLVTDAGLDPREIRRLCGRGPRVTVV